MGRKDQKFLKRINDFGLDPNKCSFDAYFLFDYTEEWAMSTGKKKIEKLPEIDVCIRHTKFQPYGGGYIPFRMRKATYVYSQNGSVLSNWNTTDFTTLAVVSLLSHILNRGEALAKQFPREDEVIRRYKEREIELYQKKIFL